jgi:molybdopterin-guanine dinucleotide biosynthesis protein A
MEDLLRTQALARPLYGLVLAGGRSSRMGRDKALLSFDAVRTQLERTIGLLQPHCQRVFCSARADQADTYEHLGGVPVIADSVLGAGPLGGILSAMRAHPGASWFVTAIDLPLLCDASISHLIGQRDPFRFASVYRSIHGGFLEPLCAVYEPKFLAAAMFALGQGVSCPGRVLKDMRILEVEQRMGDHLANINTPKDCERYFPNLVAGELFKESVI